MYEFQRNDRDYQDKQMHRKRKTDPIIEMYFISSSAPELRKVSCMQCKRTIFEAKGRIIKTVNVPSDPEDFGLVVDIMCKLCQQRYRIIPMGSFIIEHPTGVVIQPKV